MNQIINDSPNSLLLSVIVPVYNTEKYLRKCFDSIYGQELSEDDFELIVVDDGSTDSSWNICNEYKTIHSNLKLIHKMNGGQATARNLGLDSAKGKYILFVDSDDELIKDSLSSLLDVAETHSVDIAFSSLCVINAKGQKSISNDFLKKNIVVSGESAFLDGLRLGTTCGRLYRSDFLNVYKLRFTSGIYHEDVLFNIECIIKSKRFISCDIVTYMYNWNEGSTDRSYDLESIKKALCSDLYISFVEKSFSEDRTNSERLRYELLKRSESLMFGFLIQLFRNYRNYRKIRKDLISIAKGKGLLPVNGKTYPPMKKLISFILYYVLIKF